MAARYALRTNLSWVAVDDVHLGAAVSDADGRADVRVLGADAGELAGQCLRDGVRCGTTPVPVPAPGAVSDVLDVVVPTPE